MVENQPMKTVPELFDNMGGPGEVAKFLEIGRSTASEMKRRKSIPVKYWPRLVAMGKERRIKGLNYASLVEIHQ